MNIKNYENKKEKQPKKIQLKFVGTGNVQNPIDNTI